MWDVVSIFISLIVLSYIIVEGKTDYFKGAMLVVSA